MKKKASKVLIGLLSLVLFIVSIKIVVLKEVWWQEVLASIGVAVSVIINQYIFSSFYSGRGAKRYHKEIEKADELVAQGKYKEAKDILDIIDNKYNKNFVKRDILRIEKSINYMLEKQSEIDKVLQEAETFANNHELLKCKKILNEKVLWFEGYEVIFNDFLSEEQKSKGMDLLKECISINNIEK